MDTYEKKYKDILARLEEAKNVNDVCDERYCCVINDIIPELNESEDERIRKRLIDFFEDWRKNRSHCWGIAVSKILTWLEKQGEQILTNSAKTCKDEQKTAWSERDEYRYNACLQYFEEIKPDSVYYKDYLWLKSLKERIKQ